MRKATSSLERRKIYDPLYKIFVFLNSVDWISCNFSMIFTHFQTNSDFTGGGGGGALKPFSVWVCKGGGNTGNGGWPTEDIYQKRSCCRKSRISFQVQNNL